MEQLVQSVRYFNFSRIKIGKGKTKFDSLNNLLQIAIGVISALPSKTMQNYYWFVNAANKKARNQFEDEFTVLVLSSASMQLFKSNTLASFRNFFNDAIQLSGGWKVALSEIIFPTKIENVVEGEYIAFSLKEYEEFNEKGCRTILLRFSCVSGPGTHEKCNKLFCSPFRSFFIFFQAESIKFPIHNVFIFCWKDNFT